MKSGVGGGVIARRRRRPTQTIRGDSFGGAELKMMAAEQLWRGGRNAHNVNCDLRGMSERRERERETLFFVVAHIKDDGRLENAICIN